MKIPQGEVDGRDNIWRQNGELGELPAPSRVEREFYKTVAEQGVGHAVADYYQKEVAADYVKASAIARNVKWNHSSKFGELQITINLSKPEKDPAEIAKLLSPPEDEETATNQKTKPKCNLCLENEGFADGIHENMRILRLEPLLDADNPWYFQYSPYAYYNEHCIVLNEQHTPMVINRATFARLLELLDTFPGYFFGSNSDIPIVGGSILNHDHFQGGKYSFPIDSSKTLANFTHPKFPEVDIAHINWPLTTLRLTAKATPENKVRLIDLSDHILKTWISFELPELEIVKSSTDEFGNQVRHNAITPIMRKVACDGDSKTARKTAETSKTVGTAETSKSTGECYQVDLVLRNNRTTDEFPLGIFHPHPEYHYIKKENIGLIEVSGLAILPPRLKVELESGNLTREEIGDVFEKVLENCGVFKLDPRGREGLLKFAETAGLKQHPQLVV